MVPGGHDQHRDVWHRAKVTEFKQCVEGCRILDCVDYVLARRDYDENEGRQEKLEEHVGRLHWIVNHLEIWVWLRNILPAQRNPEQTEKQQGRLRCDTSVFGLEVVQRISNHDWTPCNCLVDDILGRNISGFLPVHQKDVSLDLLYDLE